VWKYPTHEVEESFKKFVDLDLDANDFQNVISSLSTDKSAATPLPAGCNVLSMNNTQHSLSLDQLSGFRFQTSSEMRSRTLFGSHCRRCCSDNISVLARRIGASYNIALHKSTFFYLLTKTCRCSQ